MNRVDQNYDEKRDFMRMRIDTPVAVSVDSENLHLEGVCLNLSSSGMHINLGKTVPVGCQLEVSIKSPQGDSIMLRALTRVTRVEAGPGSSCNLGLSIEQMLD